MNWNKWKSAAVLLVAAVVYAAPAHAQTLFSLTSDPADYPIGFTRAHWVSSINKMIVAYGYTDPLGGDNSVRAYDPATDAWEYLWPNDYTNGGPQQRDDHNSLYIPRLDEFWVWGGSRLETLPGALRSGRFSIGTKTWLATSTTDEGAFAGVVQGFAGGLSNGATAWSDVLDSGLIFGGDEEGNGSNRIWMLEPNPAGPEPYRMFEVEGGLRPPPRLQAMNLLAAAGTDFYLIGGGANTVDDQWVFVNDFWRFDGLSRTWHELPGPPTVGYQSTLTYDSEHNALIAWVQDKIYAYPIGLGRWVDITPQGMPCNFNHVAAYSSIARLHLFFGGNACSSSEASYMALALPVAGIPTTNDPLVGTHLGLTADKTGIGQSTVPDGRLDNEVWLSGLRAETIINVRVEADNGGIWEFPLNGVNWYVWPERPTATTLSAFFAECSVAWCGDAPITSDATNYRVRVTYDSGITDTLDVAAAASPPPPPIVPPAAPAPSLSKWDSRRPDTGRTVAGRGRDPDPKARWTGGDRRHRC